MADIRHKKGIRIVFSFLLMCIVWLLLANHFQNDVLVPYPQAVLRCMYEQVGQISFYQTILHTLLRALSGFLVALLLALFCAFLSFYSKVFEDFFYPILLLTRSVPNVSYIIIVLFWFSAEASVIVISFLILFPTMYANLVHGLQAMAPTLQDVLRVYPTSRSFAIRKIYLPHLRPFLFASTSAGISLSFKVGIMAEILGQVHVGIGRQLNLCRLNVDMTGVFAWTIWIIFLLFLIESILHGMQKRFV